MPPTLPDTDTFSAVTRRERTASSRARTYLMVHRRLTVSEMTRYEILRGLHVRSATTKPTAFQRLIATCHVIPVGRDVVERAAEIYADLYRHGQPIGDADILIAATALTGGYTVTTNNTRHFSRIPGLALDNWLAP